MIQLAEKFKTMLFFLLKHSHANDPIDYLSLDQQLDRNIEGTPRTNTDNLLNKFIGPNGKCS